MKKQLLLFITFLAFCCAPLLLKAESERILYFNSEISVNTNGSIQVCETIKVYSAGLDIKRGIYRTLPTNYSDEYNNNYNVKYDVLSVTRDGNQEPWHTERDGGNLIIYIGSEDVFLSPGYYTYTITYESPRQIRYFDDHDELYWNVTGNFWGFRIEQASATVIMPIKTKLLDQSAYTGSFGAQGKDYVFIPDSAGNIVCKATRELSAGEGLSFSISFPKGIITQPTRGQEFMYFMMDNLWTIFSGILLLLCILYFIIAWFRVGRDPQKGSIAVMYFPPLNLSPGALRFILKMGFDNKAFTAGVMNLAVQGYLTIHEQDGEYTLKKTNKDSSPAAKEEKALFEMLFSYGSVLKLKNTNHTQISSAISHFKKRLKELFQNLYFRTNSEWFWPGLLGLVVAGIIMIVGLFRNNQSGAGTLIFFFAGGAALLMLFAMLNTWKKTKSNKKMIIAAIILTVCVVPFFLIFAIVGAAFFNQIAVLPALMLLIVIASAILFQYLLKAPTKQGRQLMDQIEGFREYLNTAEKDELELANPPEKTPELFEKYLPYAVALGVENHWGEKFNDILKKAMEDNSYQPHWYMTTNIAAFSTMNFASSFGGSFSSAVSSSSVSPSSSGSGGGGFSGGGGGGGGGGGW
jgi:uncharacterized membrane protein